MRSEDISAVVAVLALCLTAYGLFFYKPDAQAPQQAVTASQSAAAPQVTYAEPEPQPVSTPSRIAAQSDSYGWEIDTSSGRCRIRVYGVREGTAEFEREYAEARDACARATPINVAPTWRYRIDPDFSVPRCGVAVNRALPAYEYERAQQEGRAECERVMASAGLRRSSW
jgi:hypothetical protein